MFLQLVASLLYLSVVLCLTEEGGGYQSLLPAVGGNNAYGSGDSEPISVGSSLQEAPFTLYSHLINC